MMARDLRREAAILTMVGLCCCCLRVSAGVVQNGAAGTAAVLQPRPTGGHRAVGLSVDATSCHGGLCGGMGHYPTGPGIAYRATFNVPRLPEKQDGITCVAAAHVPVPPAIVSSRTPEPCIRPA